MVVPSAESQDHVKCGVLLNIVVRKCFLGLGRPQQIQRSMRRVGTHAELTSNCLPPKISRCWSTGTPSFSAILFLMSSMVSSSSASTCNRDPGVSLAGRSASPAGTYSQRFSIQSLDKQLHAPT